MKKLFIILLFVGINSVVSAQEKAITTFILVRHAEKDLTQSSNDPDLSADGKARATRLAEILKKTDIHSVYSTPYKRTQQTVEAVAAAKSLKVMTYQAKNAEIDNMITEQAGGTVLLSGHSNTVPQTLNYLIGEEKYITFDDTDYGNLVIVSFTERGKNVKVTWLRY
jgi:broad specificity phosphatase PhoE